MSLQQQLTAIVNAPKEDQKLWELDITRKKLSEGAKANLDLIRELQVDSVDPRMLQKLTERIHKLETKVDELKDDALNSDDLANINLKIADMKSELVSTDNALEESIQEVSGKLVDTSLIERDIDKADEKIRELYLRLDESEKYTADELLEAITRMDSEVEKAKQTAEAEGEKATDLISELDRKVDESDKSTQNK